MERVLHIRKLLLRSRRLPWVVLGLTLAILAGAIALTTEQTRQRIRNQMVGRDGEVLDAVALMQQPEPGETVGPLDDPANQLLVVLKTSRLSGVMGARLFSAEGLFVESFPEYVLEDHLKVGDLAQLEALRPVSHFRPSVSPFEIFLPEARDLIHATEKFPVLIINVPLHANGDRRLLGVAQFLVQGHGIAQEFKRLDRHLARQALIAFLAGGALLAAAIIWSFRRLNRAHCMLAERTENLMAANRELALAAKTSAVGAVTAHLLHGLKNPLAGLQNFVASLGATVADHPEADLQLAIASTRRMQAMINDVVGVLQDENGGAQFEVTIEDLAGMISGRIQLLADRQGVEFVTRTNARGVFPNRVANLVALILVNLVQNGVEATPRGGSVQLLFRRDGDSIVVEVRDEGPGFPEGRPVFAPCQSVKDGGSGIGLAISKQLANHLGASLELRENSTRGSVFVLTMGAAIWSAKTNSVTVTLG
jgi:signal transduction histidine kinase